MDNEMMEEAVDMGAWLGRKQAFSGMAGRCSAADAHCLLRLREGKKYKTFGLTWDAFCTARLGISRSLADKTIRLLEEFGETYFHLTGLIPIAPEDYRLIAGAVSAEGVEHAGEAIAIAPHNAVKLAEAVGKLKRQARLALPPPAPKPAPKPPPQAAAKPEPAVECDPLGHALDALQDVVQDLERQLAGGVGNHNRAALMTVLSGSVTRLDRLHRNLYAYR